MTKKDLTSKSSAEEREQRRAAALRENLHRRKEQKGVRTEKTDAHTQEHGE
jgi:hypothetical protein